MSKKFHNARFINPTKQVIPGKHQSKPLGVIILASDMGYRMKSYGPKCLLKTGENESILFRQIRLIRQELPYSEITIVVGFEADKVIKHVSKDIRIIENQIFQRTNSVESVRLVVNNRRFEHLLILDGDLIFNRKSIADLTNGGSVAVMDAHNFFPDDKEGATIVDGNATNFSYGLEKRWARMIYLTDKELEMFHKEIVNRDKNKMYLFEIFNDILNNGGCISTLMNKEIVVYKIDSTKDLDSLKGTI